MLTLVSLDRRVCCYAYSTTIAMKTRPWATVEHSTGLPLQRRCLHRRHHHRRLRLRHSHRWIPQWRLHVFAGPWHCSHRTVTLSRQRRCKRLLSHVTFSHRSSSSLFLLWSSSSKTMKGSVELNSSMHYHHHHHRTNILEFASDEKILKRSSSKNWFAFRAKEPVRFTCGRRHGTKSFR